MNYGSVRANIDHKNNKLPSPIREKGNAAAWTKTKKHVGTECVPRRKVFTKSSNVRIESARHALVWTNVCKHQGGKSLIPHKPRVLFTFLLFQYHSRNTSSQHFVLCMACVPSQFVSKSALSSLREKDALLTSWTGFGNLGGQRTLCVTHTVL